MTQPIWSKGRAAIDAKIQHYLAGEDVVLDAELLPYDVKATIAHVEGLARIDILSSAERQALVAALDEIASDLVAGRRELTEAFEDGHSALEAWLIEKLGDVGRKVHTGRSRNDQVQVAMRLWLKDQLASAVSLTAACGQSCLDLAGQHERTVMPGYTHLQQAVPTTVGAWAAGFAEAFIDDAVLIQSTLDWIDANPLGSAAGHGVNLALDRDYTTEALSFGRLQINPQYVQNSRGKFEAQALSAVVQALEDIRRLAWDLSLFTTQEFAFVSLPDELTTGSSIMPNKRNPDLVELLRAAPGVVHGAIAELWSIVALPSGYHRDLQRTKPPTLRAMNHALATLSITPRLIESLQFDEERLLAVMDAAMLATDEATTLAAQGVPFREAYQQVGRSLADQQDLSAAELEKKITDSVQDRVSPGSAGRLQLNQLARRLRAMSAGA